MNLLEAFKAEADEHLAEAERCLMQISSGEGAIASDIDEIFRAIHTVKGGAGYVDHTAILQLAHAFESILEIFRLPEANKPSDEQIDLFFRVLDTLQGLVAQAEVSAAHDVSDCIQALALLRDQLGDGDRVRPPEQRMARRHESDPFRTCLEQQVLAINATLPKFALAAVAPPGPLAMLRRAAQTTVNAAAYVGHEEIEASAASVVRWTDVYQSQSLEQPALDELAAVVIKLLTATKLVFANAPQEEACSETPVALALPSTDVGEQHGRSSQPEPNSSQHHLSAQLARSPAKSSGRSAQLVRIDKRYIDGFMNLVSELIVTRNSFEHLFSELGGPAADHGAAVKAMRDSYRMLRQISEQMQESVMDMQLIPIGGLFQRFPKLIRDLSRQLGKPVDLHVEGAATRIDRSVAEQLGDPLLHLVRNAIDHGIETAARRRDSGKPLQASVYLRARQEHHHIIVEVADDGGGIDVHNIRTRAVAGGLVSGAMTASMSEKEALQLIFLPGFSTAKAVSALSGRGVGLDVVKRNIEAIKGSVMVDTMVGRGTTMRIVVPITMAVMNAILVRAGGEVYACPLNAVREVVKLDRSAVHQVASGHVFTLRGQVMGLKSLVELLEHDIRKGSSGLGLGSLGTTVTALIVNTAEGEVAIMVDSILRKEEIIVKPLSEELAGSDLLIGASILGNGSAILILNPSALVQSGHAEKIRSLVPEGVSAHG